MGPCPAEKQGLEIGEVSRETFLDFVRRPATSEEIGRIGTCLDGDRENAPATVKLLAELGFSDPPLLGAPICALEIDDANREEITTAWKCAYSSAVDPLRLQCALCKSPRKQGRPWCTPRPSAKLPQAVSANNAAAASS